MGIIPNSVTVSEVGVGNSVVRVDKEIATDENHLGLSNQGQEIRDKEVEKADGFMSDSATDASTKRYLTQEADVVDLAINRPPSASTGSDIMELVDESMPFTRRFMASMMRNMAGLPDRACDDAKGKERALDTVSRMSPCDTALAASLLNEFKSIKEEMWRRQETRREEIELIVRKHQAELNSVKEQMRTTEDKHRRETELIRQRHGEEMDSLIESVREAERKRSVEAEGNLPLLEMLELRRRITALENKTRSVRPSVRPACEDESDLTIIRRAPFHPLAHLFDYEDAVSKPGTPIQSEPTNAVYIDSIPLPIKSQRKFQSMHRVSLNP
jgi:hypothetical protein